MGTNDNNITLYGCRQLTVAVLIGLSQDISWFSLFKENVVIYIHIIELGLVSIKMV